VAGAAQEFVEGELTLTERRGTRVGRLCAHPGAVDAAGGNVVADADHARAVVEIYLLAVSDPVVSTFRRAGLERADVNELVLVGETYQRWSYSALPTRSSAVLLHRPQRRET
jgi:hypothetical protein